MQSILHGCFLPLRLLQWEKLNHWKWFKYPQKDGKKENAMKTALLIPIYEPGDRVLPFLKNFKPDDFDYFLVVDDGSGPYYQAIFEAIREQTPFEVIGYSVNKGKGGALKTGFKHILDKDDSFDLIMSADSDGQHRYEDILATKAKAEQHPNSLTLGVRDFSGSSVPFKSRLGNRFSSLYYFLTSGKKLGDTQTGLRAIPKCLYPLALDTRGTRFEYEMNFLLEACHNCPVETNSIETIYEPEGEPRQTHFRPFVDSVRVYRTPLLYVLFALLSAVLDISLFHVLSSFIFIEDPAIQVFISALIARVSSGIFNFFTLHFIVFSSKSGLGRSALKYLALFSVNYLFSSTLTYIFRFLPIHLTPLKVIIDIFVMVANYFLNLGWVFTRHRIKKGVKQ